MKFYFQLVVVLLIILLVPSVFGIGISPSVKDIVYTPGKEVTVKFIVSKTVNAEIELGGELNESAVLLTPAKMDNCVNGCTVVVKITIPNLDSSPGKKLLQVGVQKVMDKNAFSGTGVSGVSKVVGNVRMMVPYPGKYITPSIKSMADSVKLGEPVPIIVSLKNDGKQTVEKVTGKIIINSHKTGGGTYTFDLPPAINVKPNSVGEMKFLWETKDVQPGSYGAKAELEYDEGVKTSAKLVRVMVGDKLVIVKEVIPLNYEVGKPQKVKTYVESFWNEPLQVSVHLALKQGENILAEADSKTVTLELGGGELETFLDFSNVKEGEYQLETTTQFGEGLNHKSIFNLTLVKKAESSVVPIGEASTGNTINKEKLIEDDSTSWSTIVLILVGVLIIIVGVGLYIKKSRENDSGGGDF